MLGTSIFFQWLVDIVSNKRTACFQIFYFYIIFKNIYFLLKNPIKYIFKKLGVIFQKSQGRVDALSFFEYLCPFCFLSIEFHYPFSISYKILPHFVYYYCISIRNVIGRRDFFYSCLLYFFCVRCYSCPLSCPPLIVCLRLSHCLISFLLFPCASV